MLGDTRSAYKSSARSAGTLGLVSRLAGFARGTVLRFPLICFLTVVCQSGLVLHLLGRCDAVFGKSAVSAGEAHRVTSETMTDGSHQLVPDARTKPPPVLLVGVLSRAQHRSRRNAIRHTWATKFAGADWRLLFVVGSKGLDDVDRASIAREAEVEKDMVVTDAAMDTHGQYLRHEPMKVNALLRAARDRAIFPESTGGGARHPCEQFAGNFPCFLLKVHDQAYVNVPMALGSLMEELDVAKMQNVYRGSAILLENPVLREGVYAETKDDFPADNWPPYVSANTGALLSADVVQCMLGKINSPGYRPLHVEDAALGTLAKACNVEPSEGAGVYEGVVHNLADAQDAHLEARMRTEMNKPNSINPDDLPYHFNKRASRALGEIRPNFPELRDSRCKHRLPDAKKLAADGWDTSVIITFVEEEPTTLVRTVRTILKNTPAALLREILLIDDGSSEGWLNQMYPSRANSDASKWPKNVVPRKMLDYVVAMDPTKVKVIHAKRGGFIAARRVGIAASKGRTYCIMESHVEPLPGWIEPLLSEVRANPETIANPVINQIRHEDFSWVGPVMATMDYNNQFEMVWGTPGAANDKVNVPQAQLQPVDEAAGERHPWGNRDVEATKTYMPWASPVHAGGIYVATKEFYNHLQGYDPGMHGFSSENLDFAFRTWLCAKGTHGGGRNIVVPCSLVGHVYRMKSPAATLDIVTPTKINTNKKRVIETWLDVEGDGNGYTRESDDKAVLRGGGSAKWWGKSYDGRKIEMPAMLKSVYEARNFDLTNIQPGDMSDRKAWIRKNCKPFSWMMKHIAEPVGAKMPTSGF